MSLAERHEVRDRLLADVSLMSKRLGALNERVADLDDKASAALRDDHRELGDRCRALDDELRARSDVEAGLATAVAEVSDAVDALEADLDARGDTDASAYELAVDRQVRAWRARIDRLRLHYALGALEARDELHDLGQRLDHARGAVLVELQQATGDTREAVGELRDDVEEVLEDIRNVVRATARDFRVRWAATSEPGVASTETEAGPAGQEEPSSGVGAPALFDAEPVEELLVPVGTIDDARRAVTIAEPFAARWQVPIRLLQVRTPDADASVGIDAAPLREDLDHHLSDEVTIDYAEIGAEDVATGVVEAAGARSLLFLASERGSQWDETGSIAEAVAERSERMLVLFGPRCHEVAAGGSIVVPLDGSTRAEAALAPALAVAEAMGTRVWLVTAVPEATVATVARLRAEGEAVSESGYLRAVAAFCAEDGHNVGWEVVHDDDPVAGILSVAEAQRASMIVAATHGDTGVAKRLFGSVCFGMVESGTVPVLMVRTASIVDPPLLSA